MYNGVLSSDDDEEEIRRERRKNSSSYKRLLDKYKEKADFRNENLDPRSPIGKGYITKSLVARYLGVDSCFDITGELVGFDYDMFEHEDWGNISVKGSLLIHSKRGFRGHYFNILKNDEIDFFFNIGYDEEMKNVIRFFIVPNDDYISKLDGIYVPYHLNSKWAIFKESEEEVEKLNEIFHSMKMESCPILRKEEKDKK